jgi:hypothetical protein
LNGSTPISTLCRSSRRIPASTSSAVLRKGAAFARSANRPPSKRSTVFWRSDPTAEALLLFEDTDIQSRRVIVDARVGVISTGDFLHELEAARLIQSTDFILDEAAEQERNVERQRQPGADSTTRERLREQLAREASQEQPTSKDAKKAALARTRAENERSIQQGQEPDLDRER